MNSLLTVGSYFSFSDNQQDKSDHHVHARFSWRVSSSEILTPQLQDDGVISLACCWISLTILHPHMWEELAEAESCCVFLPPYLLLTVSCYVSGKDFHAWEVSSALLGDCIVLFFLKAAECICTCVIFGSFRYLLQQVSHKGRNQRTKAIIWCRLETKRGSAPLTMNRRLMDSKNVCLTSLGITLDTESVQRVGLSFRANGAAPRFVSLMTTSREPCLSFPASVTCDHVYKSWLNCLQLQQ